MKLKIMRHPYPNQHGWSVSLTRYDDNGEFEGGFVLISKETEEDQRHYVHELAEMTNLEVEE
jgi:hypothetical protein